MILHLVPGRFSGKAQNPRAMPAVAILGRAGLLSERARPLRFAITGGFAGLLQLGLLFLLVGRGAAPLPANALAFLAAAQVNFLLSQAFTWRDRPLIKSPRTVLFQRWLAFHACISGTAALNLAVFAVALQVMPHLPAAAAGIFVAAIFNFLANDRFAFRIGLPPRLKG